MTTVISSPTNVTSSPNNVGQCQGSIDAIGSLPDWVAHFGLLPDWDSIRKEMVSRIDVAAVYRELGVTLSERGCDGRGWIGCWPDPEAGLSSFSEHGPALINVRTGYFRSRDGAECLDLFEFMTKRIASFTYLKSLREVAWRAGYSLPEAVLLEGDSVLEKVRSYDGHEGEILGWTAQLREPSGTKTTKIVPKRA
jgi:hypothetical protein